MRKLFVTQSHIDRALKIKRETLAAGDSYLPSRNCPIALAGAKIGLESSSAVYLAIPDDSAYLTDFRKMNQFISNFDRGFKLSPIELNLKD